MEYLKKRFSEPSTYAGIGSIVTGGLVLGQVSGADAIGSAVANSANSFISGDYVGGIAAIFFSVFAIFKAEKG